MNVLILSAAAKVLLVRAFQEAVRPLGGRVIAADIAPDSAALHAADHACLLPRSDSEAFAPALERLCRRHSVRLVVPTRDGELPALLPLRQRLAAAGAVVLVPPAESLRIIADKREFTRFCAENGFGVPRTYAPDRMPETFPVFVRPAQGAGGSGTRVIRSQEEWQALGSTRRDLLIQECVTDDEYTVDVLMDLDGAPLQAVARRRLLVQGGESKKGRVVDMPSLTHAALELCHRLRLVGHNVVQAFVAADGGIRFIEVNPRFGGASNLSLKAGLDSPRRIVQLLSGEAEEARRPRPIRHGLTMLRYSEDLLVEDPLPPRLDDMRP